MSARRDTYSVVGTATRVAIDRAMVDLTLPEARVLLALVAHLTCWSRLEDSASQRQLMDLTGMDAKRTGRALRSLAERGVIDLVPGSSLPGGRRRAAVVSWPETPGHTDPRSIDTRVQQDPESEEPSTGGLKDPTTPGPTDPLPRSTEDSSPRMREVSPFDEHEAYDAEAVEVARRRATTQLADAFPHASRTDLAAAVEEAIDIIEGEDLDDIETAKFLNEATARLEHRVDRARHKAADPLETPKAYAGFAINVLARHDHTRPAIERNG